jgi:hypothetical protein
MQASSGRLSLVSCALRAAPAAWLGPRLLQTTLLAWSCTTSWPWLDTW